MYYYVYNLQGDVTHIVNSSGSIVGTYQYDAWGKILNLGSLTSIAQVNPFRYRGYYYDNESGLYYLNSRYYSAEWRRFINADSYITTGQGLTSYNMFAYCGNNPIMYVDYSGQSWLVALFAIGCCAVIGGIWGACSNSNLAKTATKKATEKSKEEQVNAQSININNITNQNYSQTKNSYTINNVNNNNMLQQKEVPKLTAGERISNAVIGASLGIAVGGAIVATYAAIGTAIIGSAAVSLPVIGMTGVQAFSWGALAFDSVTMIVLPFFGIIGEPIEYSQSN